MKKLSVIVPCYNEEEMLPVFYAELKKNLRNLDGIKSEMIFIDDGSVDGTLQYLKSLSKKDKDVKYVSFSRNFGKEAAIFCGLKKSMGDYVVVMDADLQDPPSLLKSMLIAIEKEGYDSVATRCTTRKGEPVIRSFFANCFYRILNRISHVKIVLGARDFRMMTRQMKDAVISMVEYNRFTKGIYPWVGFKTKWLDYENLKRVKGSTKWSFWKLFVYSIEGITAFSTVPLVLASFVGLFFCLMSFLGIIVIIVRVLIWDNSAYGWPSLVCFLFFMSGIQLFCIGILGQYLSKTYLETKHRPIYIVKESKGIIKEKNAKNKSFKK